MADNNPNINRIYPSEVNKKNVIVFDRTSTDSVVSAAIVKYICKNVEKDTEYESVCINILDAEKFFTNEKDYLAEGTNLNDVIDSVSFCGCTPSAQVIKKLYYIFGNKLVFFLCDEQKVGEIKKISKSIQVESSTEDSCAMILYKIVNGEILANIPDEIKYISGYRLENYDLYDLDATSVFNFEYGLKNEFENYITAPQEVDNTIEVEDIIINLSSSEMTYSGSASSSTIIIRTENIAVGDPIYLNLPEESKFTLSTSYERFESISSNQYILKVNPEEAEDIVLSVNYSGDNTKEYTEELTVSVNTNNLGTIILGRNLSETNSKKSLSDKLSNELYTYVQSLISTSPSISVETLISAGEEIVVAEEENLLNKFNVYGSDIWSVDKDKNFKACVLLTDMNLRPEFYTGGDFDEFEYIITFYRLSNASWNVSVYEIPKEESNEEVVKVNLLKYLDKYSPSGNEKVVHFNVSAQQFTKILLAKSI